MKKVLMQNFSRRDLAWLFCRLGFRCGAEVGVKKGGFSKILCESIPGLRLFCIDPWVPYVSYNGSLFNQKVVDSHYKKFTGWIDKYNVSTIKEPSLQAVNRFKPDYLDFIYLDGDHSSDNLRKELMFWPEKIRSGGIISGHDYNFTDVEKEVDSYSKDKTLFITGSKRSSSWFVFNG